MSWSGAFNIIRYYMCAITDLYFTNILSCQMI